jgi:hypothetical protein
MYHAEANQTSPVSESAKLADKIAAWSPSSNGPLVFIARERRLIEDALRSYAHAQTPARATPEMVRAAYEKYGSDDIFKLDCEDWLEAVINAALAVSHSSTDRNNQSSKKE